MTSNFPNAIRCSIESADRLIVTRHRRFDGKDRVDISIFFADGQQFSLELPTELADLLARTLTEAHYLSHSIPTGSVHVSRDCTNAHQTHRS